RGGAHEREGERGAVNVARCRRERVGVQLWDSHQGGDVREHGRVVDRADVDAHVGRGRPAVTVGDGVGETVRAVEVVVGRVRDCAVAVVRDRAVQPLRDGADGERVSVNVRVVRQDADGRRRVLVRRGRVVAGRGRVVDGGDGNADRGGRALVVGRAGGRAVVAHLV